MFSKRVQKLAYALEFCEKYKKSGQQSYSLHFNELSELLREQHGPLKCTTLSQMSKSSFMTVGGTKSKQNEDYSEPAQMSKGSSQESRNRAKS
jgi:hypothetical protein